MIYGFLNEWPLGVDLLKLQTFKSKGSCFLQIPLAGMRQLLV